MNTTAKQPLKHWRTPVQSKLAALWTSVMRYVCRDYFELYTPGKLQEILRARPGPLGPATQGGQIGTCLMMVVPSLMTSSPSP
ncbi:hypothetical protein [Rhodanobacter hydrolyticus]|uniref:hypothetical protein n=1 Tax=Rhodanobacter hydrolyticus TaxID=2250595 RepID=UPI00384C0377